MKVIKASKFDPSGYSVYCICQVAVSEQQHTALIIKRKGFLRTCKKINGNKALKHCRA
jgi:hypothetical protein